MSLRVCVVSDLHGRLPEIPECDVLLNCGDICPDIPYRMTAGDPHIAKMEQMRWLETDYQEWERSWPTSVKLCLATTGNHDWVSEFPKNCRSQMYIDQGVTAYGRSFWFSPWVSECGPWNYLANREQRRYHFDNIPRKLDVLVTHSPAHAVGDLSYGNELCGCYELRAIINQRQPKYAVFGHIHEGQRFGREFRLGGTKMFNAAMWGAAWKPVVFDLPTPKGVDKSDEPC